MITEIEYNYHGSENRQVEDTSMTITKKKQTWGSCIMHRTNNRQTTKVRTTNQRLEFRGDRGAGAGLIKAKSNLAFTVGIPFPSVLNWYHAKIVDLSQSHSSDMP